jgi:hypothetical protein
MNPLRDYGASLFIATLGVLAFAGFATTGQWVVAALTLLLAAGCAVLELPSERHS